MTQNNIKLNLELEKNMLGQLLNAANEFYSDPENIQAFKDWQKSKEEK